MREEYIPASLVGIFSSFARCFTQPSFENFVVLASGWILCQGRHCVSRVIQAAGRRARAKHFSTWYRFLAEARWSVDRVSHAVFLLVLPFLPHVVEAIVDDTLCHRSGPHIFGAGMHHDASRSTYGRGTSAGRMVSFAFGQNWVILAVRVPLPWDLARGIALPLLFRLYRPKKRCPTAEYRKRTELAFELVQLLESWIPAERRLVLLGDAEYACRALVRRLTATTTFVGPMAMTAALYEPVRCYQGHGRPRKKGTRLPSPGQLAAKSSTPWKRTRVTIYGRSVVVLVKTQRCLWYTVAGARPVKMVVTRDPRGFIQDRAYFSTDPDMEATEVLERFSKRWLIEVSFRDAKQHLGLEDPQNGWSRRKPSKRRRRKRPGPQARGRRGEKATLHTLPLVFVVYAVTVIWYLQHGNPERDVRRARIRAPWNLKKDRPSFADMLIALRREILAGRLSENPSDPRSRRKTRDHLPDALIAA